MSSLEKRWFLQKSLTETTGPFTLFELQQLFIENQINPDSLLACDSGFLLWLKLSDDTALLSQLETVPVLDSDDTMDVNTAGLVRTAEYESKLDSDGDGDDSESNNSDVDECEPFDSLIQKDDETDENDEKSLYHYPSQITIDDEKCDKKDVCLSLLKREYSSDSEEPMYCGHRLTDSLSLGSAASDVSSEIDLGYPPSTVLLTQISEDEPSLLPAHAGHSDDLKESTLIASESEERFDIPDEEDGLEVMSEDDTHISHTMDITPYSLSTELEKLCYAMKRSSITIYASETESAESVDSLTSPPAAPDYEFEFGLAGGCEIQSSKSVRRTPEKKGSRFYGGCGMH